MEAFIKEPNLGDILGYALEETAKLKEAHDLVGADYKKAQNKMLARMIECAASHYENNDRTGGDAIMNAVMYSQQKE